MELNCFIQKFEDKDVNKLINKLIHHKDLIDEFCNLIDNEKININFFSTEISANSINKLLLKYDEDSKCKKLISYTSPWFTSNNLPPKIFQRLIELKGTWGKSIKIGLCHANLSFSHLFKLWELNIDGNPFCKLLTIYIENDIFNEADIDYLLNNSVKYILDIPYILDAINPISKNKAKYKRAMEFYNLQVEIN